MILEISERGKSIKTGQSHLITLDDFRKHQIPDGTAIPYSSLDAILDAFILAQDIKLFEASITLIFHLVFPMTSSHTSVWSLGTIVTMYPLKGFMVIIEQYFRGTLR